MAVEADEFLLRTFENLRGGDHLCSFLAHSTDRLKVLGAFLSQGLRQGQKVVWIGDNEAGEPILAEIESHEGAIDARPDSARLSIIAGRALFTPGGIFSLPAALNRIQAQITQAGVEHDPGTRLLIEMGEILPLVQTTDQILQFEAGLNDILSGSQGMALCQYDPGLFEAGTLEQAFACHPLVVVEGEACENLFFDLHPGRAGQDSPLQRLAVYSQRLLTFRRRAQEMLGDRQQSPDSQDAVEILGQERNLLRTVIDNLPDRIFVKDINGRKLLANIADAQAMGAANPNDVVGRMDFEFYPPDLAARYFADDQAVMQSGQPLVNREEPTLDFSGKPHWTLTTKVPLRDNQGRVIGLVGISRDITERMQAQERLNFISTHDAVSGLYNRTFFEEELTRLERGRHFPLSIIVVDVDGMKATNDRYGHPSGDELLRGVAKVLRSAFRGDDVMARIGGDEFAVLLPDTHVIAADAALMRIRSNLLVHNRRSQGLQLSLSIGVATAERSRPLADVLREADKRMVADKARPKNGN
jgi:diguanylate cyclase (GGDEF)-like protein/PAS domain S-box-containing protein